MKLDLDPFERAYARFAAEIRSALHAAYDAAAADGMTVAELAAALAVGEDVAARRLNGPGNITLRELSDLFVVLGAEPLAGFRDGGAEWDGEACTGKDEIGPER